MALTALAGCSSSSANGSGSLNGTVDGVSFSLASGLAQLGPESSSSSCGSTPDGGMMCTSSSSGQVIAILLTNRAGLTCAATSEQNSKYANLDVLELAVGTASGTVATGTYDLVGAESNLTSGAQALLLTTSANCGEGLNLTASGGSITISALSETSVSGTFNVTFGSMGSFTGSFDEPICEVTDGGGTMSTGGGETCQQ